MICLLFSSKPDNRLQLNYLHIAKAALYCDAHFTAIIYGELASYEIEEGIQNPDIQTIMKNAYESIGENDAVSAFIDPIECKLEYLLFNKRWSEIYLCMDANPGDFSRYSNLLAKSGLYNLANKCTNETNYDCAWRLGDWSVVDTFDPTNDSSQLIDVEKPHYFALKCLQQRDEMGVKVNIKKATAEIIRAFRQSSFECTKNIYKNLMMLHLLQQIEEFCHVQFPSGEDNTEFVVNKWKYQDTIPAKDFCYQEPILAQRIAIFKSVGIRAKRKIENIFKIDEGIQQMMLNVAIKCREENAPHLAERYLSTLDAMNLTNEMKVLSYYLYYYNLLTY